MKIDVYNQAGEKNGSQVDLRGEFFDLPFSEDLVRHAYVAAMANSRKTIAHTKTRSERRGGGAKPWAQKGTGRARHGSIRSPIWRGGGITFGPRSNRSYSLKVNKKANRKAILMALSEKKRQDFLVIYDKIALSEAKTREVAKLFDKVPFKKFKDVLIIVASDTDKVIRASRNLVELKVIRSGNINILDLLHYDGVIIEEKALTELLRSLTSKG